MTKPERGFIPANPVEGICSACAFFVVCDLASSMMLGYTWLPARSRIRRSKVKVVEVILELEANEFINSGKVTRGRVLRSIPDGALTCQVDDRIKGVKEPSGEFDHVDEARAALIRYWAECNEALSNTFWTPKL
jgi:hypothetical protein